MSLAADQGVIDATARLARSGYVAILGQMLFIIGTMIYQVPPFELSRRPGAEVRAAPGDAAGKKVADANAAARRVMRRASARVPMLAGVAITVVALPLSYVGPGLLTRARRRGIAAWTWPPPSFGRGTLPKPFTAEVLESDTGKLAFLYVVELALGWVFVGFAIVLIALAYVMSSGSPIVLGAAVLLTAAAAARFPARNRIAAWIEHQQDVLDQERHDIRSRG
jgi:hypothetical protein